jgi:UDP-N-acetylmuramoylalanine--D-glutamate ligase
MPLSGARVLVVGLGRSGAAAARFLLKAGAKVAGFDENPAALNSKPVAELKSAGMAITHRPETARADWAVVSPGISDVHPLVRALRRRSVPVVDELDLASRFVRGPVIAVTGTNGKSTTTALIALMLQNAGNNVFCGGNLAPGQPLSAALLMGRRDYYVVEVSSFQLERARWLKPRVAVILNITPDHLNRHRTLKRYSECKLRILDRQDSGDYAVLNRDDALVRAAEGRGAAARCFFSMQRRTAGSCLSAGYLWFGGDKVLPAGQIRLPGRHNIQNCLAAIAAARLLGVGMLPIRRALRTFAGLPHRLEFVRRFRGVDYINSSMTTNPAAGARSLEALAELPSDDWRLSIGRGNPESGNRKSAIGNRKSSIVNRRVILIAGGREKALPTGEYVRAMRKHAKLVLLVGESSTRLARELAGLRFRRYETLPDLRAAVQAARAKAEVGDTVLFAPGFASFDQFADFEVRGEAFRKEVCNLG